MIRCRAMTAAAMVAMAPMTVGCSDRPGDRAELDRSVGRVEVGGVQFAVRDGLATVRHASEGHLVLWLSAPAIELSAEVSSGGSADWLLELHNVMPQAELEAQAGSGSAIAVVESASAIATRRRYDITLPVGERSTLTFGAPAGAVGGPFRFALLSDVQDGVDELGEMLLRIDAEPDVGFVLSAGDLTQSGSAEEMQRFQDELTILDVPWFSAIGNHDAPADTPWHQYFGRTSYHFVYSGVHFTQLDSASATVAPVAYDWLQGWLEQGRQHVHVFTTHIPPIDPVGTRNGSFGSRAEAGKLLGMLVDGGVDVTLYGHIHSYYAFENAGISAFISGGGGAFEERVDGIGRHYMLIDVDPKQGMVGAQVVEVD